MSKENEKPKTSKALIVFFVFILFGVIASLPELLSGNANNKQSPVEQMSAVEKMEIAFNGNYNKEEIEDRIGKAMILYGLELTEDNYGRAGSALVALRKEYSVDEMDILDYMIRSYVPGVNIAFPQMAGISVAAIVQGGE